MNPVRSQSLTHHYYKEHLKCQTNIKPIHKMTRSSSLTHLHLNKERKNKQSSPVKSMSLPSSPPPVPQHQMLMITPPTRSSSLHQEEEEEEEEGHNNNNNDIATALLEWKHKSGFKVDWANLFSPSVELWKLSGNIFGSIEDIIHESNSQKEVKHVCHLLWMEDESFIQKKEIASYLGKLDPFCHRVLKEYMSLFDFSQLSLIESFRKLCFKLYFKAEAQEIDRILEAFAYRYWSQHIEEHTLFKRPDIVYTIIYSVMLLNTDLYLIHFSHHHTKMTVETFCKNTISTLLEQEEIVSREEEWKEELIDYLKSIYMSIKNEAIIIPQSKSTHNNSKSFLKRMGSLTQKKKKDTNLLLL
ncbi:Sec7 domain-containing protein [Cokeromyces recurvatus]|uniref:Sec7 domain-containing protein n=1 Tax=Cokeromyces recurvatus TaxID=90255 RepID=UPI00221E42B1|nr:Sec7 domain-containing protein [Cokeromyces recurvatus]KAI7903110.1 Sec7 domain-containing protein [Cokeromyces recurvatus]